MLGKIRLESGVENDIRTTVRRREKSHSIVGREGERKGKRLGGEETIWGNH